MVAEALCVTVTEPDDLDRVSADGLIDVVMESVTDVADSDSFVAEALCVTVAEPDDLLTVSRVADMLELSVPEEVWLVDSVPLVVSESSSELDALAVPRVCDSVMDGDSVADADAVAEAVALDDPLAVIVRVAVADWERVIETVRVFVMDGDSEIVWLNEWLPVRVPVSVADDVFVCEAVAVSDALNDSLPLMLSLFVPETL